MYDITFMFDPYLLKEEEIYRMFPDTCIIFYISESDDTCKDKRLNVKAVLRCKEFRQFKLIEKTI